MAQILSPIPEAQNAQKRSKTASPQTPQAQLFCDDGKESTTEVLQPEGARERKQRYQREWLQKRRAEWLAKNGPCVSCGSRDRLEVDHVDPAQKVSHNVWSWSEERRNAELAKCRVLCYSCHKKRHEARHGTETRYRYHHCRCVECKAAHNTKTRNDKRLARERWLQREAA